MQWFYKIIYTPAINTMLRTVAVRINRWFGTHITFPVSGTIHLKSPTNKQFCLETNETCFVTYYVFWNGVDAYESTPLFCDLFAASRSFIDIGSNVGLFTVLAETENPEIRTDSFDPSPSSHYSTTRNVTVNHLKNTHIHRLAVADTSTALTFTEVRNPKYPYREYHLSGASSLVADHLPAGRTYTVQTISVDTYVHENQLPHVDFLKIDAEKAEPLIIAGAAATIEKFSPVIYCEVLPGMMKDMHLLTNNPKYVTFHMKKNVLYKVTDPLALSYDHDHDFLFVPLTKIPALLKYIHNEEM